MYILNKIVGYLVSPVGFGLALIVVATLARLLKRRRLMGWAMALALANFWLWSTPLLAKWMGVALEAAFMVDGRVPSAESLPAADVIALHGGSMGLATNVSPTAEMCTSADRVWHAARLWKAGKAPKILVMSPQTDLSTGPLLADFGVPSEAIVYDFKPRNTEEEAKAIVQMFECTNVRMAGAGWPKVLVVTSAWHMRRTMLMYRRYASNVEAIPAPCDFENTLGVGMVEGWKSVLPDPTAFLNNSIAFHEWLGYWGYKIFR